LDLFENTQLLTFFMKNCPGHRKASSNNTEQLLSVKMRGSNYFCCPGLCRISKGYYDKGLNYLKHTCLVSQGEGNFGINGFGFESWNLHWKHLYLKMKYFHHRQIWIIVGLAKKLVFTHFLQINVTSPILCFVSHSTLFESLCPTLY